MFQPTMSLRFVKRAEGKDVRRVLQQQWVDNEPPDGATGSDYEWRDVPAEDDAGPASHGGR